MTISELRKVIRKTIIEIVPQIPDNTENWLNDKTLASRIKQSPNAVQGQKQYYGFPGPPYEGLLTLWNTFKGKLGEPTMSDKFIKTLVTHLEQTNTVDEFKTWFKEKTRNGTDFFPQELLQKPFFKNLIQGRIPTELSENK